jgi:hypothetical protein
VLGQKPGGVDPGGEKKREAVGIDTGEERKR